MDLPGWHHVMKSKVQAVVKTMRKVPRKYILVVLIHASPDNKS